jgi:hypothetical protein
VLRAALGPGVARAACRSLAAPTAAAAAAAAARHGARGDVGVFEGKGERGLLAPKLERARHQAPLAAGTDLAHHRLARERARRGRRAAAARRASAAAGSAPGGGRAVVGPGGGRGLLPLALRLVHQVLPGRLLQLPGEPLAQRQARRAGAAVPAGRGRAVGRATGGTKVAQRRATGRATAGVR